MQAAKDRLCENERIRRQAMACFELRDAFMFLPPVATQIPPVMATSKSPI
jgi:hypothetical protein